MKLDMNLNGNLMLLLIVAGAVAALIALVVLVVLIIRTFCACRAVATAIRVAIVVNRNVCFIFTGYSILIYFKYSS